MLRNVLASEDQFDELRLSVIRSFDKLRGRLTREGAQEWIGASKTLDRWMEGLLPFGGVPNASTPSRSWREEDGVIYLTVTLDKPTAGDKWIPRTKKKGNRIGDYAKSVVRSKKFKSSAAGTYKIVILKGSLFDDDDRVTQKIRAKADEMKLVKPNADIACLIREQFSDKEIEAMGLNWIVVMHEPIEYSDGHPYLLTARRDGGGRWLSAYYVYPDDRWPRGDGFAFLAPQVP